MLATFFPPLFFFLPFLFFFPIPAWPSNTAKNDLPACPGISVSPICSSSMVGRNPCIADATHSSPFAVSFRKKGGEMGGRVLCMSMKHARHVCTLITILQKSAPKSLR